MSKLLNLSPALLLAMFLGFVAAFASNARAETSADLDADVHAALESLYRQVPGTEAMAKQAKGVLVFPNIVKAGFVVGAQYGQGAMVRNGQITGYYSLKAASYGLQAGVQSFGYALFLMTDSAIRHLSDIRGWEVGVGPSIVVLDEGVAKNFTTRTMQDDVFAATFSQRGLMAGVGLQGSKIKRIEK